MDERQRRIGKNEALFREVNERVEELSRSMDVATEPVSFLCECGDEACFERIELTVTEYEALRADSVRFAIKPGHAAPDVEAVVERNERYWTVEKHAGEPARLADALDPRTD